MIQMWGLEIVRLVRLEEDQVRLAPPEYVIMSKLQFYREGRSEKHIRDIHRMLVGLGEDWDRNVLLAMSRRYGLTAELDRAMAYEG